MIVDDIEKAYTQKPQTNAPVEGKKPNHRYLTSKTAVKEKIHSAKNNRS